MKNKIPYTIRLEKEILEYLEKLAKENHTTISHELRRMLLVQYKVEKLHE